MPEAATDTAPPDSPPGGSTNVFDSLDPKNKELMTTLTGMQERQMGEKASIMRHTQDVVHAEQARASKWLDAEGQGPDALPPKWDAEAESRKHAYDPFDAFGSFGSVFGILASAFSRLPMDSALNASASAMTAIKQGKEDEYKRAYQAWKDNTDLVIKRQNMVHQVYQDAIAKMSIDMQAGRIELESAMIRFGDENKLALMRAGHIPEVMQAIEAEQKATAGIKEAQLKGFNSEQQAKAGMELRNAEQELEKARSEASQAQDPGAVVGAQQKIQAAIARVKKARERMQEVQQTTAPAHYETEADRRTRVAQNIKLDHPEWDDLKVEEELNRREALARSGGAGRGPGGVIAQDYETLKKQYREQVGPDKKYKTLEQADHAAAQDARRAPMSAENIAKREEHISGLQTAKNTIDRLDGLLKRIPFAVGMPGYATRFGEAVSNTLGGKSTEYFQVKGMIEELQTWGQEQMNLARRSGRPLKSNEQKLYSLLAGLNFGDTTARTRERYQEIRALYDEFQRIESDILQDKWTNPVTSSGAAPKGNSEPFWRQHPKVGE